MDQCPGFAELPYEARRVQRFPEKFQRPLSEREKMLIEKVKEGVYDERRGVKVPNLKVFEEYKCPRKERMIVMDEVRKCFKKS